MAEDAGFSRMEAAPAGDTELEAPVLDRESLTIAEVSQQFGVTCRALRFYEAEGLVAPQRRGAVRRYGRTDCRRLALLLRAKALGFTLAEIGSMLAASADENAVLNINRQQCFEQIKLLERRQREIEAALAELRRTYSSFYARIAHSRL